MADTEAGAASVGLPTRMHMGMGVALLLLAGAVLYGFYQQQRATNQDDLLQIVLDEQRRVLSSLLELGTRKASSAADPYSVGDQAKLEALARQGAQSGRGLEVLSGRSERRRSDLPLGAIWERVEAAVPAPARTAPGVAGFSAPADPVLVRLNVLSVNAEEVARGLLHAESTPAQIHAATRQLMLIERIKSAVRQTGGGGIEGMSAADRAGRDSVLLGEVNNALLVGSPRLRVERVTDPNVRSYLQVTGREFRAFAGEMEALIARAGQLREAPPVPPPIDLSDLMAAGRAVQAEIAEMEERAGAARGGRVLTQGNLAWATAGWVVLFVFFSLRLRKDGRTANSIARQREDRVAALERETNLLRQQQRDIVRRTDSANQRMAETLWRFVDGDYSKPEAAEGVDDQFANAARTLAVQLSRGLGDVKDAAGKMSGATALLNEAASNLGSLSNDSLSGLREVRSAADLLGDNTKSMSGELQELSTLHRRGGELIDRGAESLDALARQLGSCTDALAEVRRTIRVVSEATEGLQEVFVLADDLTDRARILALNISLQTASGGDPAAAELARFAECVMELSRVGTVVKTAIETDATVAMRAARQAASVLDAAGSRTQRTCGAVDEIVTHSHHARAKLEGFSMACREQLSAVHRQSHALSELVARAEQGRRGAVRLSGVAARLGELSTALERRSLELLSGVGEAGTVVNLSVAASPPQSEDQADSIAGTLSRAEEIPADARRVTRDDPA